MSYLKASKLLYTYREDKPNSTNLTLILAKNININLIIIQLKY